ncbi:hypothetical protein AB0N05_24860 [Nocardia sp. NPDC051030]|uniref:nuclear transport factor 2 family protein n=1 Tax=Nocardia sp. NPDC051030 TaxID=3155162 RepID=UPI00341E8591
MGFHETSLLAPSPPIFLANATPHTEFACRRGDFFLVDLHTKRQANIDSKVVAERIFAAGDDVIQIGRTVGSTKNGTAFDIPEVHIWHLRTGLVARYDAYIDTPAMLAALEMNR